MHYSHITIIRRYCKENKQYKFNDKKTNENNRNYNTYTS